MDSKYSSLSLGQLRTELRCRNAKLSGRKKELIERLEAYERNQNFQQQDDILPEFNMSVPKASDYKDVNTDTNMAAITVDKCNEYMGFYCVNFDQKVDLYEETFLLYLRSCSTERLDYIRSACKAEMKKRTNYIVDVAFQKNGFIHEAQCECGAGEGPFGHCKHIRTVLYACCKFMKSGELKLEQSCTERLQKFHKTKKHTGSPLKARNLNIAGADEVCDIFDFDPRPAQFRNTVEYKDHFYNMCMNFKGISKTPIFQTFTPSNMRAYANDHDYFELSHEEHHLKATRVEEISEEERECIEHHTRGQRVNE